MHVHVVIKAVLEFERPLVLEASLRAKVSSQGNNFKLRKKGLKKKKLKKRDKNKSELKLEIKRPCLQLTLTKRLK